MKPCYFESHDGISKIKSNDRKVRLLPCYYDSAFFSSTGFLYFKKYLLRKERKIKKEERD